MPTFELNTPQPHMVVHARAGLGIESTPLLSSSGLRSDSQCGSFSDAIHQAVEPGRLGALGITDAANLRRIAFRAAYAQQLVAGGGGSGPDLTARCVAYLYALAAGIACGFLGNMAGFTQAATLALTVQTMLAVAASLWPASLAKPPKPWERMARAWLTRAQQRLLQGGDRIAYERRSSAERIQAIYRGHSCRWRNRWSSGFSTWQASGKTKAVRVQAARTLAGHIKHMAGIPMALLSRLEAWWSTMLNGIRDLCLLSCCGVLLRVAAQHIGFYVAMGLQLAMASNAAREMYLLIQTPPALPTSFGLLLFASVVPLADTIGVAAQTVREKLEERAPSCWPFYIVLWLGDALSLALDLAYRLLALVQPILRALPQALNESVKTCVDNAIQSQAALLFLHNEGHKGDRSKTNDEQSIGLAIFLESLLRRIRSMPLVRVLGSSIRAPFVEYGAMVRGSPLKSMAAIIALVSV